MRIVKIPELSTLENVTNSPTVKTNQWFDRSTDEMYFMKNNNLLFMYPCRTKEINGKSYYQLMLVPDGTDLDEVDKNFTKEILSYFN